MSKWFDSFLQGFSSILDMGATHKHEQPEPRKMLSSEEAWAADAEAIAGDIEKAMKYVENQISNNKNNKQ